MVSSEAFQNASSTSRNPAEVDVQSRGSRFTVLRKDAVFLKAPTTQPQQPDSRSRSTQEVDQRRLPIPQHHAQVSRNRRHQHCKIDLQLSAFFPGESAVIHGKVLSVLPTVDRQKYVLRLRQKSANGRLRTKRLQPPFAEGNGTVDDKP